VHLEQVLEKLGFKIRRRGLNSSFERFPRY